VPRGGPAPSVLEESDTATIVFERNHLPKLEAAVRFLKKNATLESGTVTGAKRSI